MNTSLGARSTELVVSLLPSKATTSISSGPIAVKFLRGVIRNRSRPGTRALRWPKPWLSPAWPRIAAPSLSSRRSGATAALSAAESWSQRQAALAMLPPSLRASRLGQCTLCTAVPGRCQLFANTVYWGSRGGECHSGRARGEAAVRSLPVRRAPRPGRDGRRLQSLPAGAEPLRGPQGAAAADDAYRCLARALPSRGGDRGPPRAPQHPAHLRLRRGGRPALHGHAAGDRWHAARVAGPQSTARAQACRVPPGARRAGLR